MNAKLETKIKNLPSNPGIYQFLNDKGRVIYVGKANNLKNRVRSYFHENLSSPKTTIMVKKINDLELIITDNEIEALVLENNLIKKFKPRYNVNLKDDKSFPYIKVTKEPYPRVYPTRRVIKDGSKYFGPYTDVKNMKTSLRMINEVFKIRSCKLDITQESIDKEKFKVCLDYHIKKCDGPCEGLISEINYNEMVNEVVKVLKGKTDELIKDLNLKMNLSVEQLEFEKAAEIRDKINQLAAISSRQKVVSDDLEDRDVISIAYEGKDSACSIFNIRSGKLVGKKQLRLAIGEGEEETDIYSAAIKFYYGEFVEVPKEILLDVQPSDSETFLKWLDSKSERKVKFIFPQRGDLKSLVKMCKENAILQLKELQLQKMKAEGSVNYSISALKRDLRLKDLPKKIECFDISNLQGTDSVASMVVFENGKPKKSQYRKFIIKDVNGPDDFLSMQEVIRRRYSKLKEENISLPELIMVDGGKGQLSSAVEVLNEIGYSDYNIIGLAKRLEEVFLPGQSDPASIPKTSSGLKLLQQIRNEAHRFAVTFHRDRRSKRTIKTELTDIKGIGSSTAYKLLKELGSLSAIKASEYDKLVTIIGKKKADILINHFKEEING
ncbi:MAG: excinuclease ABC subunit C [Ignavibacteria bacterium GWA2_35_9]|nr:MAG: excinuclease ABC subunit C [Ignavibacteria bacterium GWA2_35_9]OGU50717.1 MAG: excinuclease ABC subunit C [Ignavibacteria bacterium GWC2_36_12]OGV02644.1 MAG: excinuclease ABC subunit C [Ignavibacteria bacterium RIFOXYB2_FULL_36_7]